MHTINFLGRLVEHHQVITYALVYVGITFEGEFFLICTGILTHLGGLNFGFALLFVLLGGFTKTLLGYEIGGFLFRKFNSNKIFKYIQKRVHRFLPKFNEKPFWSIFISKFMIGANHLVIILSGYEKIDYKKYLKAEVFSTIIWAPLLLSLGYFFSYTAIHVSHTIWKFLIVVLILFIIFILFDKLVSWLYEVFEEFYE